GRKNKGFLQAGSARLQKTTKKVPLPPRSAGAGDRGQEGKIDSQSSAVARKSCVFQPAVEQLPGRP
ncbi:MAG TPA: hypothetical protein PKV82_12235, partial [Anaerolineae bacterium]|nr:hypothetical protein [Anaerolineae bacterium]